MPPSRSSLVVNHRVALSGTPARTATPNWHLSYIDSRPGAVRAADVAHAEEREISSYMDRRPGASRDADGALFGQAGNVSLREARESIGRCEGAVLRTVVSVRREDAEALRLTSRQDWERFLRARWQQEFAAMAGVPENRVRWVAAFHTNQENNLHCHVLSWDAGTSSPWDSLLPKAEMEAARSRLTDAALEPELARIARERTEARDAAVAAVRSLDLSGDEARAFLPAEGSLKYAHLERFHPDAAEAVARATDGAVGRTPEAAEAVRRHEETTREMGELKGLTGAELDEYVHAAEADLTRRLRNAAISAMVGDREALSPEERLGRTMRHPEPESHPAIVARGNASDRSPSAVRRREEALAEEISSCARVRGGTVSEKDADEALEDALRRSPSVERAVRRGVLDLKAAVRSVRSKAHDHDTGSDVARELVSSLSRRLARGIAGHARKPEKALEVSGDRDIDVGL